MGTTEMSALQQQGPATVQMMDRLLGLVRWFREKLGTKASDRQLEYLQTVEDNAEKAKKGAQDASTKSGATGVPKLEVRPPVGEEASLRQQGQTPKHKHKDWKNSEKKKVLLGPNAPMEGEELLEAAVVGPGNKVATGPHHPGILDKLGVKGFEDRESRNTPDFGYSTNRRPYVPRDLGTKIAEKSGQDLREFDEPIHSDEVQSATEPDKTVAEQKPKAAKNQPLEDLMKARQAVQALAKAAAKDPHLQPELEKARGFLAEAQKAFDLSRKQAPPTAPTGEAPAAAPSPGKAGAGGAAPAEQAIREPTVGAEEKQGPAEEAWRAHDEEIRRKLQGGGTLDRADRMKNRDLFKAAMKENPALETEGAGLTMKGRQKEVADELGIDFMGTRMGKDVVRGPAGAWPGSDRGSRGIGCLGYQFQDRSRKG